MKWQLQNQNYLYLSQMIKLLNISPHYFHFYINIEKYTDLCGETYRAWYHG